jgi:hypothetical protein
MIRPAGPSPLELTLAILDVGEVTLRLDARAEPEICGWIGAMADAGAYSGALLTRKLTWVALTFPGAVKAPRITPRRATHSRFDRGSIGWSWSAVPSDGAGELFITLARADGLDARYAEIGKVVGGLERLEALPILPAARLRGRAQIGPAVVANLTRRRLDVPVA